MSERTQKRESKRERERKRKRESVCVCVAALFHVCVCVCVCVYVCVCAYVYVLPRYCKGMAIHTHAKTTKMEICKKENLALYVYIYKYIQG